MRSNVLSSSKEGHCRTIRDEYDTQKEHISNADFPRFRTNITPALRGGSVDLVMLCGLTSIRLS